MTQIAINPNQLTLKSSTEDLVDALHNNAMTLSSDESAKIVFLIQMKEVQKQAEMSRQMTEVNQKTFYWTKVIAISTIVLAIGTIAVAFATIGLA